MGERRRLRQLYTIIAVVVIVLVALFVMFITFRNRGLSRDDDNKWKQDSCCSWNTDNSSNNLSSKKKKNKETPKKKPSPKGKCTKCGKDLVDGQCSVCDVTQGNPKCSICGNETLGGQCQVCTDGMCTDCGINKKTQGSDVCSSCEQKKKITGVKYAFSGKKQGAQNVNKGNDVKGLPETKRGEEKRTVVTAYSDFIDPSTRFYVVLKKNEVLFPLNDYETLMAQSPQPRVESASPVGITTDVMYPVVHKTPDTKMDAPTVNHIKAEIASVPVATTSGCACSNMSNTPVFEVGNAGIGNIAGPSTRKLEIDPAATTTSISIPDISKRQ